MRLPYPAPTTSMSSACLVEVVVSATCGLVLSILLAACANSAEPPMSEPAWAQPIRWRVTALVDRSETSTATWDGSRLVVEHSYAGITPFQLVEGGRGQPLVVEEVDLGPFEIADTNVILEARAAVSDLFDSHSFGGDPFDTFVTSRAISITHTERIEMALETWGGSNQYSRANATFPGYVDGPWATLLSVAHTSRTVRNSRRTL